MEATELDQYWINKPANLENSAVVTGLEKVSFHSNTKERKCQRMFKLPHNCTHLAAREVMCKKDLHDQDNHDGMITHLEPGHPGM